MIGNPILRCYLHGPGVDKPLVWHEGASTGDGYRQSMGVLALL